MHEDGFEGVFMRGLRLHASLDLLACKVQEAVKCDWPAAKKIVGDLHEDGDSLLILNMKVEDMLLRTKESTPSDAV